MSVSLCVLLSRGAARGARCPPNAPCPADSARLRASFDGGNALLRGLGGAEASRRVVDTDALVRREYWKRIATQVFLANVAATLHYIGGSVLLALKVGSPLRWTPLQLQKLVCGVLSAGLLTLCTLQRFNGALPMRWRPGPETVVKRLVMLELITYAVINVGGMYEYMTVAQNCAAGLKFSTCGQRYLLTFHTAICPKWITSQITGRLIFFPECVRNVAFAVCLILLAASDGSLTPLLFVTVLLEAVASFLYGMLTIKLCRALLVFEDKHLPVLDTCPRFLRPWREKVIHRLEEFVLWLLDEPVLDANCVGGLSIGAVLVCRYYGDESLHSISAAINMIFLSLMTTSLISKKAAGTIRGMHLMARRLGLGAEQRVLFTLRAQLSTLPTESAILGAASSALATLLPGTVATAVAIFEDDENGVGDNSRVALLEVSGNTTERRAAMEAAIAAGSSRGTSVAFVCYQAPARGSQHAVAWSGDFPSGLLAFSDWRAASRAGLAGQAVTVPLSAGPVVRSLLWMSRLCCLRLRKRSPFCYPQTVGFVQAHFDFAAALKSGGEASVPSEQLLELCEIVGSAVFCVRAQQALSTSQSIVNDIFPQHVARALEQRAREESAPAAPSSGADVGDDSLDSRLTTVDELRGPARVSDHGPASSSRLFAETFPAVTIIFADIVGFTALSATRSPESVMAMLDNLFTRFDALCARHAVYKVWIAAAALGAFFSRSRTRRLRLSVIVTWLWPGSCRGEVTTLLRHCALRSTCWLRLRLWMSMRLLTGGRCSSASVCTLDLSLPG